MYFSTLFITSLAAASTAHAFSFPSAGNIKGSIHRAVTSVGNIFPVGDVFQRGSCPAVWTEISTTLTEQFLLDGQCTDAARAAIRGAFHDCFNGACDGSLILAGECSNTENTGLQQLCDQLGNLATEKGVGVADLIQFAGAHAIKTCPGGPTVPVKVGRKDSSTPSPMGILPSASSSSGELLKLFASKGFTAIDLVALIGAHSTAKQSAFDPSQAGASMDSTPGQWDTKFYSETQQGKAPFTLPSDKNLARDLVAGVPFKTFALSQGAWAAAFVPAMSKMSMMGVTGPLTDCTSALPGGSGKRDVKRSPLFDRLKW